MNDEVMINSYDIIGDVLRSLHQRKHPPVKVADDEVSTVAAVATKYFHHDDERAS
jgi:hypothetical protein